MTTYVTQGELYSPCVPMPLGVSVHELGHVLGLHDLYSYLDGGHGIGDYSLMASGSWGTDKAVTETPGNTPVHLDAWSKVRLGFVKPTTINATEYWRDNINSIAGNYNILQITNVEADPTQYFMVENRQHVGFDRGLPRSSSSYDNGILIYHIDERVYSGYYRIENTNEWTARPNDNNLHKFIDIEKYNPDNNINPFYVLGDTLTPSTSPNSKFHSAGHTTNPLIHINCHPQTLASNIYIKVHSPSGNIMNVETGFDVAMTTPNLTYNASSNNLIFDRINFSTASTFLRGNGIRVTINKKNSLNAVIATQSLNFLDINNLGSGTWLNLPSDVNTFTQNQYIEILAYAVGIPQQYISRHIISPSFITFN